VNKIGLVILLCVLFIVLALLIDPEIIDKIPGVVCTTTTMPTTTIATTSTTTTTSIPTTEKHVAVVQGIVMNISSG